MINVFDNMIQETAYRYSFETFKSNVCHLVKGMGDIDFLIEILQIRAIDKLWEKEWHVETFYLLAMLDYLSRINNIPLCSEYDELRNLKCEKTIYPSGIIVLSLATESENPKIDSLKEAIPEFLQFNIVESEIRNVY